MSTELFYIFFKITKTITIVDFEKLVEKDPKRDEILNRVKTGLGVLNNDEEWYNIFARQYKLSNRNTASFFAKIGRAHV